MTPNKSSSFRMIMAIVLSALIMIIFNIFFAPKPQQPVHVPSKESVTQTPTQQIETKTPLSTQNLQKEKIEEQAPEKIITQETDLYQLEFSDLTGTLKKIVLKKYKDHTGKNIEITPQRKKQAPLFYQLESMVLPRGNFYENADGSLSYIQENENVKIEKQFIFSKDNYHLTLKTKVLN